MASQPYPPSHKVSPFVKTSKDADGGHALFPACPLELQRNRELLSIAGSKLPALHKASQDADGGIMSFVALAKEDLRLFIDRSFKKMATAIRSHKMKILLVDTLRSTIVRPILLR